MKMLVTAGLVSIAIVLSAGAAEAGNRHHNGGHYSGFHGYHMGGHYNGNHGYRKRGYHHGYRHYNGDLLLIGAGIVAGAVLLTSVFNTAALSSDAGILRAPAPSNLLAGPSIPLSPRRTHPVGHPHYLLLGT